MSGQAGNDRVYTEKKKKSKKSINKKNERAAQHQFEAKIQSEWLDSLKQKSSYEAGPPELFDDPYDIEFDYEEDGIMYQCIASDDVVVKSVDDQINLISKNMVERLLGYLQEDGVIDPRNLSRLLHNVQTRLSKVILDANLMLADAGVETGWE